jgi:hypothetical protein
LKIILEAWSDPTPGDRSTGWRRWFGFFWAAFFSVTGSGATWQPDGCHVYPGESIQESLEQAARNPTNKVVKVHAGVYQPDSKRQALIWFNRLHDGVRLEAVGEVTLTAANPDLADPKSSAYPAVVNHVVFFGDGVSSRTVMQGFKLTGANHFLTKDPPEVEVDASLPRGLFYYADGGAVKIFGASYPTLRALQIVNNYASPCAGGVSVEHAGHGGGTSPSAVVLENCIFRDNHAQITGAAVDLLPGSSAVISNCLFVGNVANLGVNYISDNKAAPEFTNSAPLTVFPGSRVTVLNSTFTGNRNGVEDLGQQSIYQNCLFWRNSLGGAFYEGQRYELNAAGNAKVVGCFFGGPVLDPNHVISQTKNKVSAVPDPMFDAHFQAKAAEYENVGFRHVDR